MTEPIELDGEPTAVYRLYNQAGDLLYVGVSSNLGNRLAQHAQKDWWPQVVRKTAVLHGSRGEALNEEDRAIRKESPIHNVSGSPARPVPKRLTVKQLMDGELPEAWEVCFPPQFVAYIDAYAKDRGLSRAKALFKLLTDAYMQYLSEESAALDVMAALGHRLKEDATV